jgi:hypothetical protein
MPVDGLEAADKMQRLAPTTGAMRAERDSESLYLSQYERTPYTLPLTLCYNPLSVGRAKTPSADTVAEEGQRPERRYPCPLLEGVGASWSRLAL